eukprot:SAG31_NODE_23167_length_509_cov_12.573171_1_plen_39_part_01
MRKICSLSILRKISTYEKANGRRPVQILCRRRHLKQVAR